MKLSARSSRSVFAALFFAAGCSGGSKSPPPDSKIDTSVATSAASAPDAASPCPHTGKWALCSIERRLRQAGFVVKPVDEKSARRAGFSVAPTAYTLGKSRLEVFLYPDSAALSRDMAKIDTVTAGPAGAPSQWGEVPPTLIRSANLAAVILSQNQRQAERVVLALTAGAPQPGSPR